MLCAKVSTCLQGRTYILPDVWIRPAFGGKGRKVTGQLEAHANGFRYSSPKGETLDIMYRYVYDLYIFLLDALLDNHSLYDTQAFDRGVAHWTHWYTWQCPVL